MQEYEVCYSANRGKLHQTWAAQARRGKHPDMCLDTGGYAADKHLG